MTNGIDKATQDMLAAIAKATDALMRGDKTAAAASLQAVAAAPGTPLPPPELLERCEAAHAEVESAQALLDEAMRKRSECAKVLLDKFGAGPFLIRGQWMTVIARAYTEGEQPTYFFRALRGSGAHPTKSANSAAAHGAKARGPARKAG